MAREIGFRKPYVAPVTVNSDTTYTAGTPVKLGRGINCTVTPSQEMVELESDDGVEGKIYGPASYGIEVEVDDLTPEVQVVLYGGEIIDGIYVPSANQQPKTVAYLDEVLCRDLTTGADYYKKRVFYVGTFGQPTDENGTKKKAPDVKSKTISGTFDCRLKDNRPKAELYGNAEDKDETKEAAWFTAVQEQGTVTP